jgi:hypothetical protein
LCVWHGTRIHGQPPQGSYENFNRNVGFTLSWIWYPITNTLSNHKPGTSRGVIWPPTNSLHWLPVNCENGTQTGINRRQYFPNISLSARSGLGNRC